MAVVVGIDEAGYGPLLGPLVVSSAAFEVPDQLLKADMWAVLADSVGKSRSGIHGRLLINDSKQVYSKSVGIKHLERATLTFLKCLGHDPDDIAALLNVLCPECIGRLDGYEWYRGLAGRRLAADKGDLSIAASVLSKDMARQKIRPLWMKTCCLDVVHYNRLVEGSKNKSLVLFDTAASLISDAFGRLESGTLQVVVDRQGGRANYRPGLMKMFEGADMAVLRQDQTDSSYELKMGNKVMRIHFVVGADSRFLPVALASMACKYIRELLNEQMNDYFAARYPTLKPTAGYWKDGTRFIEELKAAAADYDALRPRLVRIR
jgi:ribonuclease HII